MKTSPDRSHQLHPHINVTKLHQLHTHINVTKLHQLHPHINVTKMQTRLFPQDVMQNLLCLHRTLNAMHKFQEWHDVWIGQYE